jgi:hypothetical protein
MKKKQNTEPGSIHLNKWFLDFVGNDGKAMIFYAAELSWLGWKVPYTSWLRYDPISGVDIKSRFRKIQIPVKNDNLITWSDPKFGVEGTWESSASPIETKVFDSEAGSLNWNCFQPSSKVSLRISDQILEGTGYAEQLILTAFPWKIPMDELRWGRFVSPNDYMVWIELRQEAKQQWLWLNGQRIESCEIEDDHISIPDKSILLELDKGVVLESEKKIFNVVEKLIKYIPGFNKIIPLQFLMADESKWFSNGILRKEGKEPIKGHAIHELVNFKPNKT